MKKIYKVIIKINLRKKDKSKDKINHILIINKILIIKIKHKIYKFKKIYNLSAINK
jgi:hypothetical protein